MPSRRTRAAEPTQKLLIHPNNTIGSLRPGTVAPITLRPAVAAYETTLTLRIRSDAQRGRFQRAGFEGALAAIDAVAAVAAQQERVATRHLQRAIEQHPAWPWLQGVRGIGHVLAARLVSRLDIRKAKTPSSFWTYCGLATAPGIVHLCDACGARMVIAHRTPPRVHRSPSGIWCANPLIRTGESERVSMPRAVRGERLRYNPNAKVVCYLIGLSFVRRGDYYRELYAARRARTATVHPEWPDGRRYLDAQRFAVKRFLADLWCEWRTLEGLPNESGAPGLQH